MLPFGVINDDDDDDITLAFSESYKYITSVFSIPRSVTAWSLPFHDNRPT